MSEQEQRRNRNDEDESSDGKNRRRGNEKKGRNPEPREHVNAEGAQSKPRNKGRPKRNSNTKNALSRTTTGGTTTENKSDEKNHTNQSGKPRGRQAGNKKKSGDSNKGSSNLDSDKTKRQPDRGNAEKEKNRNNSQKNNNQKDYPPYYPYSECLQRYAQKQLIRGKLRVLPAKEATSFVTCDRGHYHLDICIPTSWERNRALDGDTVFVEIIEEEDEKLPPSKQQTPLDDVDDQAGDEINEDWHLRREDTEGEALEQWQDDDVQMNLWNPIVPIARRRKNASSEKSEKQKQYKGRVVHVLPPMTVASELSPSSHQKPRRRIVGSLKVLQSGTTLLTPNNKSLPQFLCPSGSKEKMKPKENDSVLYHAEYEYGSWKKTHKWPPCMNVKPMGKAFHVEDEIHALLVENQVDHGEFSTQVLQDVDQAVESGLYLSDNKSEMGWKPTPDMYKGRRDYRSERIFTIDPTTAKDLDDALHIKELPDGRIEIGVHIADVSFFVQPTTAVDAEAQRRATTVYLVDRTVPMLPRPLCEVACSLNENVERLAFSCVWKMNRDGTLRTKKGQVHDDDVWYGRTVIKSCARLDYATAQNIIDGKVGVGESESEMDETLWPSSRRPTGGHTIEQVAADVRLMHRVAMARRRLRFDNGALALHGIKLTFQLDTDGQTPTLAAPYPLRDSNRLVEEFMLLANYLVAQRLITHAKGRALLRHHPEPLEEGLDKVAEIAKAGIDFDVDISSSQALHASLSRLGHECNDALVLQCVTQMLMTPMQPAEYFAAGMVEPELWRHFALNIPYYTHFTSPIRRYADVIVHRLLQATIDGADRVKNFTLNPKEINEVCDHCNEKRMASKEAQERCDRVFLSLFVQANPMESELGIVLSVGVSTFTVYVPSLGVGAILFLEEHKDVLTFESLEEEDSSRRILLQQKESGSQNGWGRLEIKIFTKLLVTIYCKDKPPIDIKLKLQGPYKED